MVANFTYTNKKNKNLPRFVKSCFIDNNIIIKKWLAYQFIYLLKNYSFSTRYNSLMANKLLVNKYFII